MMESVWLVLAAFLLDLAFGDPRWLPHPVRAMGSLAAALEARLRRTALPLRFQGILAAASVIAISSGAAWAVIRGAAALHPLFADVVSVLIMYSCFATRDLADHALAVLSPLAAGRLKEARQRVSWMVGRDTEVMDEDAIALAATESVAENTVDGVTAPIFYALLLGPLGVVAYKAASTLDSTFGYRNERYMEFGWASARFDDLVNFIPARLTVFAIALAAAVAKLRVFDIFRAVREGAALHESPNAGYPESAFAGALGVMFGGERSYGGVPDMAPVLGVRAERCNARTLRGAIGLMRLTAFFFLGGGVLLSAAIGHFLLQ
ncbi:MAG: adenosylcobinamide-phosphate synthase [Pelodictyon luteolum]|uniref:Cobalamin biosynthesis protein CobD n=2 Tax=Pelodictyon luteolum TaxID=1100 RepID=Q3B3T1_CHLL3|nr:adenosylcobinamide-phosphate synthase CbiB [Pelodictyon luteolum]ABB24000.1 adenosylcobinamide-phosphate synthase [Pelodictyon luteolum DSM 273]KZK75160.1 MAG: adenosylcobinamide-phosphate synthase [Pelodictyon luteolum]